MKRALIGFLCFVIIFLPAVSALAEATANPAFPGLNNILMIVSLDKTVPKDGKTFAMGCYLVVLDEEGKAVKFTSFPYNLALPVQTDKGTVTKQLQTIGNDQGPEGLMDVLKQNFGIEIDHWLMVNLTGLADFVDVAGGIEVDLPDLSINEKGSELKYMTSKPYVKVEAPGLQTINGIQAMAYISDTNDDQPTIAQEEERFRQRHEVLIRGIFKGLGSFRINVEGLLTLIADSFLGSYTTDLTLGDMLAIGGMDLSASVQYEQEFLFVPREIFTVKASNGWESLGFTEDDVQAVGEFLGNSR